MIYTCPERQAAAFDARNGKLVTVQFVCTVWLNWFGEFGQRAKMYPTRTNGYANDQTT